MVRGKVSEGFKMKTLTYLAAVGMVVGGLTWNTSEAKAQGLYIGIGNSNIQSGWQGGSYRGIYGNYGTYYRSYHPGFWEGRGCWRDTGHYDYYPGGYVWHGNHYDYIPGHYHWHDTGPWHHGHRGHHKHREHHDDH